MKSALFLGQPGLLGYFCVLLLLQGCATPLRPGQRWVKRLSLHGNSQLTSSEIISGLKTQKTGWWPWAKKQVYDPSELELDLKRVTAYYAANGFFLAKITRHEARPNPDGDTLDVHVTVQEGPPASVSRVELQGLSRLSRRERKRVTRDLGLSPGQRFVHQRFQHARALLRSRLKKVGYAYAEVKAEARVRLDRRSVSVRLDARPGPLVRFGRCIFRGHGDIPVDKLQPQVTWTPGQRFDARLVVQTRNRLLNLRVFTDVSTAIPETPAKVIDVTITVRRSKLRELRLGAGLGLEKSRQEVHLSAHWTWRNFLGGLRTLSVMAKPAFVSMPVLWDTENSGPGLESHVKLTQPNFLGSAFSLYGKLGYDVVVEEGYHMHGLGLKTGTERFFSGSMLRWGASWNFLFYDAFNRNAKYEQWDTDKRWIDNDPFRAAFLETFLQLDLRDDAADPRAGFWASARMELGHTYLGSDYSYLRITPEVRGYVPLGTRRVVLALRAMMGYLHPLSGDDDSPMYRRYKLGGPTSHRGFSSGRLSAQLPDQKNPSVTFAVHGNFALLFSADIRVRVVKLFGNWLHVGAFADGGDSVLYFDDLEMGNLHWAVGGSLMYATSLGVINFSLGTRLNRLQPREDNGIYNPDPDERLAFHIILGGAF